MAQHGTRSKRNLRLVHPVLVLVLSKAVKHFDHTVISGGRTAENQFELFKQGREFRDGQWVIVGPWVTKCDGYEKISDHQIKGDGYSWAADAVPYPVNWEDVNRMRYFAGYVVGLARAMYEAGEIDMLVGSWIDWDKDTEVKDQRFEDLPHFFVYNP